MEGKYEKMWKRLEELVERNLKSYERGDIIFVSGSVFALEAYKEVQDLMRRVEREVILNDR